MGTAINELGTKTVAHHIEATANGNGKPALVGPFGLHVMDVQITGTATVHFEGTMDGLTWVPLRAVNLSTGAASTSTSESGIFMMPCAGLEEVRARLADVSGTVTVMGRSLPVAVGDLGASVATALASGHGKVLIQGKYGSTEVPVKVDDQGRLVLSSEVVVDVGDISIGKVEQGKVGDDAEPWQVSLTGQTVTIAETQYRLHPDGITLIGPAASRPTVADAVAAVGKGVCYWAEDTGEVSMANSVSGTWRSLGVA